jgi:hypothetical protein
MEAIERYAFDQRDTRTVFCISIVGVSPVADCKRLIDAEMELVDISSNFDLSAPV